MEIAYCTASVALINDNRDYSGAGRGNSGVGFGVKAPQPGAGPGEARSSPAASAGSRAERKRQAEEGIACARIKRMTSKRDLLLNAKLPPAPEATQSRAMPRDISHVLDVKVLPPSWAGSHGEGRDQHLG